MMRLCQGCFFLIRLSVSMKCGWFIRWRHWFGWFMSCNWIRLVIQQCFWRVIWWQWGRGIRLNIDILYCRMDTFLFLCVLHCGFCILLIFRNLLILIHTSVHFILFLSLFSSSCAFLSHYFSLQTSSWRWSSSSISWVLTIASLWRNTSSDPSLDSFIVIKAAEACGCLFLSGWDQRYSLQ